MQYYINTLTNKLFENLIFQIYNQDCCYLRFILKLKTKQPEVSKKINKLTFVWYKYYKIMERFTNTTKGKIIII